MHRVFINQNGRLRSGWRVIVFIFAFIAAFLLLITVLRLAYVGFLAVGPRLPRSAFIPDLIYRFSLLGAALGAGYVCARWLEGLPWRSLGLTLHLFWLRDLVIGFVVGFASLALAVGVAAAAGGLEFSINDASTLALGKSMLGSATYLFVAALAEEAIFRGYALQTFSRARLVWLGVLVTSLAFGLGHLQNPNVVPTITLANTVIAGIWLAIAYVRTRSLWLPQGVHWGWNWALGWFFGVPISGATLVSNPLLKATDVGPEWLTGGRYGIEGGVACTVAVVISSVFLFRGPWLNPTPEMKKLTSEENPVIPAPVVSIRPID